MKYSEVPKKKSIEKKSNDAYTHMAEMLGAGRMSVAEKAAYLREHGSKFFQNPDFVTVETYTDLFRSLNLHKATIINVGAGFSITGDGVSPIIEALSAVDPDADLIPIDYNFNRAKSWDLLETTDVDKNNQIKLQPMAADATALPFHDMSVEGYFSTNLINEPRKDGFEKKFVEKMFSEAYRVLKPGGFLIVSSFGYFLWKNKDGSVIYNDDIDVEQMVVKEQIEKLLLAAGFHTVRDIPLSDALMHDAINDRKERREGTTHAGVVEACAFIAYK